MSLLSDFLKEQGITPEMLIATSKALETQSVTDRTLSNARSNARREKKAYAELKLDKPKSLGRGLTPDSLRRAIAGAVVPRLVRKKVVRAVNVRLASAKKEPVDIRPLFNDVKVKRGKSKAKK